jgi:crotonobetainyl-CoA:carnitine CoA-transferase CaiB-like acyl-CoA transferase
MVGEASYAGLPFSLNDLSDAPWTPAPTLGQHTAAILASLGYSEADVGALARSGVI